MDGAMKEVTDKNFESEVLNCKYPVLVCFTADWCQPCYPTCLLATGLEGKYTHSNFRDSAETACKVNHAGESPTDALMGHKLKGSRSDYIDPETYPQISEPASKAIHDFYFGK